MTNLAFHKSSQTLRRLYKNQLRLPATYLSHVQYKNVFNNTKKQAKEQYCRVDILHSYTGLSDIKNTGRIVIRPSRIARSKNGNSPFRKWKYRAQKMQIPHYKIKILCSENADFALKNCSK